MKILIVNYSDSFGGAARAAYRLQKALEGIGVDCRMLVQDKRGADCKVIGPKNNILNFINLLRAKLDNLPVKFFKMPNNSSLFSPSWLGFSGISKQINDINPDIVHLHWICGAMMSIEDIAKINAPIVWSLHDMWAFTDGFHYCDEYEKKSTNNEVKKNFLRRSVFKRKHKTYLKKKDIIIIGLSKWIHDCSKSSFLLGEKEHFNLPNPINTNIFKSVNKDQARNLLNLPLNKKIVLYGAMSATSDVRKGFKELSNALKKIDSDEIEFAVFGASQPKNLSDLDKKINYLGHINDDISMVNLYSAVDLLVVPSLQENLSNVIMESLACGNPVVAFDIGGNSDMIEHKYNGYLAQPFDTSDMAYGINWILNNKNINEIKKNARKKVEEEFDSYHVAERYFKIYKKLLAGRS